MTYIQSIKMDLPYSDANIGISLNGKNLAITGPNGSGKTVLLTKIYNRLEDMMYRREHLNISQIQVQLKHYESLLSTISKSHLQYDQYVMGKRICQEKIEAASRADLIVSDFDGFCVKIKDHTGVIEMFPAMRESAIHEAKSASGLDYETDILKVEQHARKPKPENLLEQHLVNLYVRQAFAVKDGEKQLEKEIGDWMNSFENNLKFLMEDNSVEVSFDSSEFKVYINQAGKTPYTFQTLSSGFSSIMFIVSRLVMRAEILKVTPSDLYGVAFVDEIDAHLHVSLQKKILPFLVKSFPSIQFIVSSHSPFVLTSVDGLVVFDMKRGEQIENLTSYSYESVLEGLLGVVSSSHVNQQKILELMQNVEAKDVQVVQRILESIDAPLEKMDEETRFFVNKASLFVRQEKHDQ